MSSGQEFSLRTDAPFETKVEKKWIRLSSIHPEKHIFHVVAKQINKLVIFAYVN